MMRVLFGLIGFVMRYAVKIINLILAEICPTTKLNSFHLRYFIYPSYNCCKFVIFVCLLFIIKTRTLVCVSSHVTVQVSVRVTFTSQPQHTRHIKPDGYTSSATQTDVGSTRYKVFSSIIYQLRKRRVKILFY